jgi:hypothetical protein
MPRPQAIAIPSALGTRSFHPEAPCRQTGASPSFPEAFLFSKLTLYFHAEAFFFSNITPCFQDITLRFHPRTFRKENEA